MPKQRAYHGLHMQFDNKSQLSWRPPKQAWLLDLMIANEDLLPILLMKFPVLNTKLFTLILV